MKSLRILSSCAAGMILSAACAHAATPDWEEHREDIIKVIEAALDAREEKLDATREPAPTRLPEGSIPGYDKEALAGLARLIDERLALRAPQSALSSEKVALPSQEEWVNSQELGTCLVDGEGTPITDMRVETFRPGFDFVQACWDSQHRAGRARGVIEALNPGPNGALAAPSESNFQFAAGSNDARVSLKFDFSDTTVDANHDGVVQASSLVLSAPVNKDDEQGTDFIGLDGLASDFQVEYNYSRINAQVLGSSGDGEPALFRMPTACADLGIPMDECRYSEILRVARKMQGKGVPGKRPDGTEKWMPEEILEDFSDTGYATVQGFRMAAGYDTFFFFDPSDLSKEKAEEVPWGAGGHFGWLTTNRFIALGFDYQRDYEAADKVTACPTSDEPVVTCVTGALGKPTSKSQHLLWTEGRWLVRGTGVSAKVTHDLRSSVWDVSVPIYLFHNTDGLLNGGVRLGWSTEDQFSAGIFVGVPFRFRD